MNYKKSYLLILLSLLMAMLAACAGTALNGNTDSAAEGDESVNEAAGTSDIFTFAMVIDPADLDPSSNYDAAGLSVIGQLYETLTYFNMAWIKKARGLPETAALEPVPIKLPAANLVRGSFWNNIQNIGAAGTIINLRPSLSKLSKIPQSVNR